MKLIAHTFDGMNTHRTTEVTSIHVWYNRILEHPVELFNIGLLLDQAKKSKQMQIYTGDFCKGQIDAFEGSYLSIYGALPVYWLELNGKIIYRKWEGIEKQEFAQTEAIYN